MINNNFSDKLTNIRAIAILIVVLGHSIILYDPHWVLFSPSEEFKPFMFLKYIINLIQMPLFFSISGYLYFWTVNKKDFKMVVKSKVFRILIPFTFVLMLYTNPLKHYLQVPGYESYFTLLCNNLRFNELGHLWFLPVLFVLFLLNYIPFRWKSPQLSLYFILALVVIAYASFVLPSSFLIRSVASNWVFFYVGGVMNKFKTLELYDKKNKYMLSILFIFLLILGIVLPSKFTIPISLLLIPCTYLIGCSVLCSHF